MSFITIDRNNIENEHICCAIGNDKQNQSRARTKKEWMKERFAEGLVFKRLDERGKVFIEYMPVEAAWKPIMGQNLFLINCLWVSGQFKGKGHSKELLDECIQDAKTQKKDGIAVVSSSKVKPFLTDKKFYLKYGFTVVDTAPPYFELLFLGFHKEAKPPAFTENAKKGVGPTSAGFAFVYSNQCPFMEEYVALLSDVARRKNVPAEVIRLQDGEHARRSGSPFGTLGIYRDGIFITHELMTEAKFEKLIDG